MSELKRRTQPSQQGESAAEAHGTDTLKEKGKEIGEEIDALLDEIDGVLEENAEEFVAGYIQRGGQ
jgi:prokaryotic ubiquitin-like protein Pup